nr:copia protein [Tanacetum cinerariifolium]
AQTRKQGDKTENKDKGKSLVVTIIGFRDLNAEFEECNNNITNGVNAASSLVFAAGQNYTSNTNDFSAAGPSNAAMPNLKDLSQDTDDVGAEADINNMESIILTRSMARAVRDQGGISQMFNKDFHTCMFACFLSQEEPKRVHQALKDLKGNWYKWVYRNKKEERGIVIRNKARLVAQGHTQEEGIDYEEAFAPVTRIEAIRMLLAYASFMGFLVYQMDVKSAFIYATIEEEVYVCQPPGFEDLENPDKVYKVVKALYGLHQAPRAWESLTWAYGIQRIHPFDLVAYSDSDYAGASLDTKSTTGGCQFLGCRLISWQCKKQTVIATSSTEAEYVVAASGCAQNQIGDLSTHTTKYISPALTQKVFANIRRVGKGFSGVDTPLFEGMLAAKDIVKDGIADEQVQVDTAVTAVVQETVAEDVANEDIPSTLTPLILPSPPSHNIPSPSQEQSLPPQQPQHSPQASPQEHNKAAQKLEITKLKARVQRLERVNKVKSSKLRRLKKVGTSQQIKSSDDMEDVFNQGRMIDDLDKDKGIELAEIYHLDLDHPSKVLSMQEDDSEVQELLLPIQKGEKGVIIRDPEEELSSKTPTETPKLKDKGKARFDANMRFLFKTREEMEEEDQEVLKSINETLAQKAAKRRKLSKEAQEVEDLKKHLEVVDDEDDDVFTEATPLARKMALRYMIRIVMTYLIHNQVSWSISQVMVHNPDNVDNNMINQDPSPFCRPTKVEVRKELPKVSMYSIDHQPQSIQEDLNRQRMNDVHNIWIESRNELLNTTKSLCEMIAQREQAANLNNHTPKPLRRFNSICYDNDDDDDNEERDKDLHTILEKESDEFIKSSVADLVPIPKESEDTFDSDKECDLSFCDNFVILSNPLFNVNDDFTSSNDESLPEEEVQEENFKIYLNPLFEFDDKYISSDVNPLFNEVLEDIKTKDSYVPNLDEPALLVIPLSDANEDECFDPGGDID